ncbi:hypothetical protein GCM10029978_107960 [Actinoallomurus acanthiterrae]
MDDVTPSKVAKSGASNISGGPIAKRKRNTALWTHKDLAVLGVGIASSGVAAVVGIAKVPWFIMLLAGSAITCVAALITRALDARTLRKKVNALWLALAIASSIPFGAFAYHQWLDPSKEDQGDHALLANGRDPQFIRPADSPGGPPGYSHSAIIGGTTVWVHCFVKLPSAGVWYWLANDGGWMSQVDVQTMPGMPSPHIPRCSADERK